ncbi:hypothetical protein KY284_001057 [Solanum tuberosum]|nr:hypothetical protein KY284_001057 [Solanum tuberosum]
MDELRDKRKKDEGHVEVEAQGEGEKRKLKGKAKLLLAEHKEIREDMGFESALILKDHELQANPSHSSLPHSISLLLQDPREALVMDIFVRCPNIPTGVSFKGNKDLSCRRQDDEITPSDVTSGVNLESSIVLASYTCYSNPLWCEAFPPKDGNLFLENESTLVGKKCDEEEGGVCFPITSSSWILEPSCDLAYENTLDVPSEHDTFLYYLFTYDDAHVVKWSMLLGGTSAHLINGGALDPILLNLYPFDPGGCLKAFELVGVSSFGWCSLVVEKNDHCPCSPFVGLIAMTLEDIWLFLVFESLRGNDVRWITSSLSIHELQCFDGVFTRMEVVCHVWMPRREFHALHGNICTLKELPVGKHPAWMIAWSMGSLTKRGGASEECAPFGELQDTSMTHQNPFGEGSQDRQLPKEVHRGKLLTRRAEDHWRIAKWIGR